MVSTIHGCKIWKIPEKVSLVELLESISKEYTETRLNTDVPHHVRCNHSTFLPQYPLHNLPPDMNMQDNPVGP